jgi:hypothetical protein
MYDGADGLWLSNLISQPKKINNIALIKLITYYEKKVFKTQWWLLTKRTTEENIWRERLVKDDEFQLFRIIQPNIKAHKAWAVAKSFPEYGSDATYVVHLCSVVRYDNRQLYDKCGKLYHNLIEHLLVSCDKRDYFWQNIITFR